MTARPPTIGPAHQRRLSQFFRRLRAQGQSDALQISMTGLRTIVTDNGTIDPPSLPTLAGDVIGAIVANTIAKIRGTPVSGVAPVGGQALVYNATTAQAEWGAPGDSSGEVIDYSSLINQATTPQGAVFSASTVTADAPLAFDVDDATYWLSLGSVSPTDPASGAWVRTDLGSAETITYYRVVQPSLTQFRSTAMKLQSSTDDSTWTDRVTFGVFGDSGLIALGTPVSARYWRLLGVSHAMPFVTNYWGVATLALYSGTPTIQAPGHSIQDEGTGVTQRTTLNFVGAGVSVADTGGKTTVTVPGVLRYAVDIGDNSATTFTVTHNLGTRDVIVSVRKVASTYDFEEVLVKAATTNTITVTFDVAPTTNEMRVVVLG